jgi:hypothetical protein
MGAVKRRSNERQRRFSTRRGVNAAEHFKWLVDAIPFDVAGTRTIHVDHHDLDSVEAAKHEIIEQIGALERDDADIETPISISLDLQLLRQSERPEERSLADLVSAVGDLRTGVSNIESRFGTREQPGLLEQLRAENETFRARLEDYLSRDRKSAYEREHFDRIITKEITRFASKTSPSVGVLLFSSRFRDEMPWLYELGIDIHRLFREGKRPELEKAVSDYKKAVEFVLHSPLRETFASRDAGFLFEKIEPLLYEIIKSI